MLHPRDIRRQYEHFQSGFAVLKSHPKYSRVHVWINDEFAKLRAKSPAQAPLLSPERWEIESAKLEVQAIGYLALVDDRNYQGAYEAVSLWLVWKAWQDWSGMTLDLMGVEELRSLQPIIDRWINESHKRLVEMEDSKAPTSTEAMPTQVAEPIDPAGVVIRSLREECRMTVEELAEAIGVSPRSVERHESGETRASDIRAANLREYERVFSEKLGRKVVLR